MNGSLGFGRCGTTCHAKNIISDDSLSGLEQGPIGPRNNRDGASARDPQEESAAARIYSSCRWAIAAGAFRCRSDFATGRSGTEGDWLHDGVGWWNLAISREPTY